MSENNRIFDHDQQKTWFQCCAMIATLVGRAVTVSRLHDADANAKVILKLEQGSPDTNYGHLQGVYFFLVEERYNMDRRFQFDLKFCSNKHVLSRS